MIYLHKIHFTSLSVQLILLRIWAMKLYIYSLVFDLLRKMFAFYSIIAAVRSMQCQDLQIIKVDVEYIETFIRFVFFSSFFHHCSHYLNIDCRYYISSVIELICGSILYFTVNFDKTILTMRLVHNFFVCVCLHSLRLLQSLAHQTIRISIFENGLHYYHQWISVWFVRNSDRPSTETLKGIFFYSFVYFSIHDPSRRK